MNQIKNIDSLKLANTLPSKDDKINMIGKLVCETADLQRKNENLTNILTELEECLKEKFNAIKTLREMLGKDVKILNPDINGIEMGYKDIQDKIQELKEKYK